MAESKKERIQKIMADKGVASRRACEELIRQGRVTVDGRKAEIGQVLDPRRAASIAVNGRPIIQKGEEIARRVIMLYKPRGYVTTVSDEQGRKCVVDLLEGVQERVYPVGRLDKNSEGLLLLTNDGDLANGLMHPRAHVGKRYRVTVDGAVGDDQVASLAEGVQIDSGKTQPALVRVIEKTSERTVLEITLYEGKNRQIRKMCEARGLTVKRLKRLSVAGLALGMLQPGEWRDLTAVELKQLQRAVNVGSSAEGAARAAEQKAGPGAHRGDKATLGRRAPHSKGEPRRGRSDPALRGSRAEAPSGRTGEGKHKPARSGGGNDKSSRPGEGERKSIRPNDSGYKPSRPGKGEHKPARSGDGGYKSSRPGEGKHKPARPGDGNDKSSRPGGNAPHRSDFSPRADFNPKQRGAARPGTPFRGPKGPGKGRGGKG